MKMGKEILTFGNIRIEKKNYRHITLIFLGYVDFEKVLVSNKIIFGEKSTLLVSCIMVVKSNH